MRDLFVSYDGAPHFVNDQVLHSMNDEVLHFACLSDPLLRPPPRRYMYTAHCAGSYAMLVSTWSIVGRGRD